MEENFDKLTFKSFDSNAGKCYTVESKDRIEERRPDDDPCENFWLCVAKWIAALVLSVAVLFCVAGSKVFLFVLGQHYRDLEREVTRDVGREVSRNATNSTRNYTRALNTNPATNRETTNRESIFIMLVLVLMIPQMASLLFALWKSVRAYSHPWPSSRAVLLVSVC